MVRDLAVNPYAPPMLGASDVSALRDTHETFANLGYVELGLWQKVRLQGIAFTSTETSTQVNRASRNAVKQANSYYERAFHPEQVIEIASPFPLH
jgi:hypothetical protein